MTRNVRLHSRDVELLELLADRRIETLGALHERLWPGCTRKSAYNRLGQLARAGYLEHLVRADPVPRPSNERRPSLHLYALGPKAPSALRIRNRPARKIIRLPAAFIDHQLATNRVGDWLGVRLLGEIEASAGLEGRHRPDAAYHASPDHGGRDLVLVEVDLGHYSKARILDKVAGFRKHPDARSILFASPTTGRADLVAKWIREHHRSGFMRRCDVFTFEQLQHGPPFAPGTEPVATPSDPLGWYGEVLGDAGCT